MPIVSISFVISPLETIIMGARPALGPGRYQEKRWKVHCWNKCTPGIIAREADWGSLTWKGRERPFLWNGWGRGKKVLDLGCRDANLTRHFLSGNQVVGADIDIKALQLAAERYGIEIRQVDLNNKLPFPDYSFDVLVLAETLEHLPYPQITLGEIKRVLNPGGVFMGNVPLDYHLGNRFRVLKGKKLCFDETHCQHFSYNSLKELLNRFFAIDKMVPLKSERIGRLQLARYSMNLFAKNVAFFCRKNDK